MPTVRSSNQRIMIVLTMAFHQRSIGATFIGVYDPIASRIRKRRQRIVAGADRPTRRWHKNAGFLPPVRHDAVSGSLAMDQAWC
jgi:hypothetical protein